MANARPVIATAVGGVVDLLGETIEEHQDKRYTVCRRGLSVQSNDADAVAAGMFHLIKNPELRKELGNRGLEFVAGNYSRERLLSDIKLLYKQLMERGAVQVTYAHRGIASSPESRFKRS
jgi:glycosyltransferase involved in cell wall biosynthesis